MIAWLALFLLVVGISFVLAFRSMKDYQEIPQKEAQDYGLFLMRTPQLLEKLLDSIHEQMLSEGLIISLERLFKGKETTLTIFGPKKILERHIQDLNLLELEDYAVSLDNNQSLAWEVGVKTKEINLDNIFKDFPDLGDNQFFWQIVLYAKKGADSFFETQIRAVVYSQSQEKRKELADNLQNLGVLTKVPIAFSNSQIMNSYALRSLSKDSKGPILSVQEVVQLLKV